MNNMELTREQKKALDDLINKSPPLEKLAPKEYAAFEGALKPLVAKYKAELGKTMRPAEDQPTYAPMYSYAIIHQILIRIVSPMVSYYIATGVEMDAVKQIAKEALIERSRKL